MNCQTTAIARLSFMVCTALLAPALHAQSASFPTKPIRILIGSAPGGGLDSAISAIVDPIAHVG